METSAVSSVILSYDFDNNCHSYKFYELTNSKVAYPETLSYNYSNFNSTIFLLSK